MTLPTMLTRLVATTALVVAPFALAAQDGEATDQATGDEGAMAGEEMAGDETFSDETLDHFVTAALEIASLRETFSERIQAADTDATREALADEATTQMRAVVTSMDELTLEEYRAIGELAQRDEDLADRIMAMVQQRVQTEGGEAPADGG